MSISLSTQSKRDRLIDAATTLFQRKGVVAASLADIAKEARIPIGNVYYYFKTKEDLALATIMKHQSRYNSLYALLDKEVDDPRERLIEAVMLYEKAKADFTRYGCPIGKIIMDSGAENSAINCAASKVFQGFINWAEVQFNLLGHEENSYAYASMLMANIQGAILLAKALADETLLASEITRLIGVIQDIPNKRIQLGKVNMQMTLA